MTFTATGVDSCRAGWLFVSLESHGPARWGVVQELGELVRCAGESDRVFVDIPIGLPDGPAGRTCDRAARKKLGWPRMSSVFPAPARAVLGARDFEDAKQRSLEATGKKVSKQTFAIVPKICEVDALPHRDAKARRLVREIHPEVCFWALNGCKPMKHDKEKEAGFRERLGVLKRVHPTADREICAILNRFRRKEVARDDAVDAMVAAVTAAREAAELRTLPACPPPDSAGLPMEMVYAGRVAGCDPIRSSGAPRTPPPSCAIMGRSERGGRAMVDVACVVDCRDELGESPVWCPADERLYWLDIKGQTISRFTPETGERKTVPVDEQPGSLALREKGGMVVAFYGGFRFFDMETGAVETIREVAADTPESRMNDGRCDRQGRFWAGSMDDAMAGRPLGALYRLDADLGLHEMESGIVVSNSIAFSPDGGTMYFADLGRDTIWAYDLDATSGALSNKRVFAGPGSAPGVPDGSTVDAEGYLWNARWNGGCLARFAPDGTLERTVELPFQQVTCPMFGGPDLDRIYVTGARVHLSEEALAGQPQAGGVFAVTGTGCRGLPEPRFKG